MGFSGISTRKHLVFLRITANRTFHPFVSSPPGRFALKTFRPMDVLNVS